MVRLRKIRYWLLGLGVLLLCVFSPPVFAYLTSSPKTESVPLERIAPIAANPDQQAQLAYQQGQYQKAADLLEKAQQQYIQQGRKVSAAIALSNLSLTYQQLGQWDAAEVALQQAQQRLENQEVSLSVQAQILDVRGQLEFATGKLDEALATWKRSEELYGDSENTQREILSRLHQSQALQAQGLFQQVSRTLESLEKTVSDQPDNATKANILRQLGDNLRATGNLDRAEAQLQKSLAIATALQDPTLIAASNLSLGNISQVRFNAAVEAGNLREANRQLRQAFSNYQQVSTLAPEELKVQAILNSMRLLISPSLPQWETALKLYPTIRKALADLPPSRSTVLAYASLAENMITMRNNNVPNVPSWSEIATLLVPAQEQAQALNDDRSQSMVLGTLGHIYEQGEQWDVAQDLSRQALAAAQRAKAEDLGYQWEWQLGRLLKAKNQETQAIAAYTNAFKTLTSIRSDLVTANPDVQFSFRKNVEPIYRELVQLLVASVPEVDQISQLKANGKVLSKSEDQARLRQARDVMEALQVAELENFFQAACIDKTVSLDEVVNEKDTTAAVLYAVLLGDRLEVVMKLPKQDDLIHYSTEVSSADIENLLQKYRSQLTSGRNVITQGQTLYNWLLKPAADQGLLSTEDLKTLIFVLDGNLRLIPMATLHDGNDFLVKKYAISLVLGLEVRDPQILPTREELQVLAAALENPPPEEAAQYAALPGVTRELGIIKGKEMPVTALQERAFTKDALTTTLENGDFNIVHLATHGQFGSDRQNTYILAADGRLTIDELGQIFRGSRQVDARLEMLILSACKTATGDSREVLGIAGAMVQSGARSAIATLWSVDDAASVLFTETLYGELAQPGISRAEALRRAQAKLLERYPGRPRFWAPYVLVGSWR